MDRPSVPFCRALLDETIIEEDQGQPGEARGEYEGQLRAERQDTRTLSHFHRHIPDVSVPAKVSIGHDDDRAQTAGEDVGDEDENVVDTWPRLGEARIHADDDRERDQDDEDNVDHEQLIASSHWVLIVRVWPVPVLLERYISHLAAYVGVSRRSRR